MRLFVDEDLELGISVDRSLLSDVMLLLLLLPSPIISSSVESPTSIEPIFHSAVTIHTHTQT